MFNKKKLYSLMFLHTLININNNLYTITKSCLDLRVIHYLVGNSFILGYK